MNKASDAIVWILSFCIASVAVYTAAFGIIDEIYQRSITVAVSLIVAIFGSSLAKLHQTESHNIKICLLYTSPSPRDKRQSRMPSSA